MTSDTQSVQLVTQRQRVWRTFTSNRTAIIGLAMAIAIAIIAVAAPVIAPYDPLKQDVYNRLVPPNGVHLLGQDDFGRDVLSRIIYGARVSLLVGICSVLLGGAIGTAMGVLAGYKGGRIEAAIMRLVDILLAFPDLITGLLVLAVLGSGLFKMIIAIGIVISPRFARLAHGPTLSIKEGEFVEAARAIGVGDLRMLRVHILPNVIGELLVMASLWTASAIRIEANLSFIGLGVPPPTPTWGNMIQEGVRWLTNAPWLSAFPGLAILITVLSFNLMGDGLRDVVDPKLQR